jgi:hypothetical protein
LHRLQTSIIRLGATGVIYKDLEVPVTAREDGEVSGEIVCKGSKWVVIARR